MRGNCNFCGCRSFRHKKHGFSLTELKSLVNTFFVITKLTSTINLTMVFKSRKMVAQIVLCSKTTNVKNFLQSILLY